LRRESKTWATWKRVAFFRARNRIHGTSKISKDAVYFNAKFATQTYRPQKNTPIKSHNNNAIKYTFYWILDFFCFSKIHLK